MADSFVNIPPPKLRSWGVSQDGSYIQQQPKKRALVGSDTTQAQQFLVVPSVYGTFQKGTHRHSLGEIGCIWLKLRSERKASLKVYNAPSQFKKQNKVKTPQSPRGPFWRASSLLQFLTPTSTQSGASTTQQGNRVTGLFQRSAAQANPLTHQFPGRGRGRGKPSEGLCLCPQPTCDLRLAPGTQAGSRQQLWEKLMELPPADLLNGLG